MEKSLEYEEEDPIFIEMNKLKKMNNKSKQKYLTLSKKTFDLFNSLFTLRSKNSKIYTDKPFTKNNTFMNDNEKDINCKEDILETLTYDLDMNGDDISEFLLSPKSKNKINFRRKNQSLCQKY